MVIKRKQLIIKATGLATKDYLRMKEAADTLKLQYFIYNHMLIYF